VAILVDARGRLVAVPSLCVIGRSSACAVRVDDARVSGAHARLSWSGAQWILRDLGSRNGTSLNHKPVPRDGVALSASDRISLASDEVSFVVVDVAPPTPQARVERSGEVLQSDGGVLVLPSPERPLATVYRSEDRWLLDAPGDARPVSDGDRVLLDGEPFVLCLPVAIEPTADAGAEETSLRDARLLLRVSRDEERVEVVIEARASRWVLPPRSHFYTLLLMARARQRDEAAGALPEASRGWLSVDELCGLLASDENKVNVDMHRIRRDFGGVGLKDGGAIVERRRGAGQLRLASARVSIETIAL
jgi:pSer/pThr/pTyr-binding forkhead associated (FHA) protein